jgi:TetR/AcrR family transcriptional regulator, copper-responsive repressor
VVQKKAGADDAETGKPVAEAPRRRGRPRTFEPEAALAKALEVFREGGFAATSLDDLGSAMGINRPSLYGAFGDKRQLFLKSYARYRQEAAVHFAPVFDPALSLRPMLEQAFARALELYLAGERGPLGCLTVMTASSEAMEDAEIRDLVQKGIRNVDKAFSERFRVAVARGELSAGVDCDALARLVTATFHTLAIRARAREARSDLEALVRGTVDVICGSRP